MHEETYLDLFTPRHEEPSLSSFEEKSSEFDWLERKLTRKQKYEGKTEQVLCIYISSSRRLHDDMSLRTGSRDLII